MNNLRTRTIAATAAVIATAMTLAVATTPLRAETVSVPVGYGDLDVATPAGAAMLHHRILRAADTVCGSDAQPMRLDVANCRARAIANARTQVALAQAGKTQVALAAR